MNKMEDFIYYETYGNDMRFETSIILYEYK